MGTLQSIQPGDHACGIFADPAQEQEVVATFLADGVRAGEKAVYVGDGQDRDRVLAHMQSRGVDVPACVQKGQLEIVSAAELYLPRGRFDMDATLDKLGDAAQRAGREGYPGIRASGEMSWATRDAETRTQLIEYESKLTNRVKEHRLQGICQYDLERFPAEVLLDVLETHPKALVGHELHDNVYYVPPAEFLGPDRYGATLRRWLGNLGERTRLEAERGAAENARVQLERAQAVNSFRSRFLNMASHELRTPLTPIRLQLDLLRRRSPPDEQAKLEILARGVLRLNSLVQDLVEVGRLESGRWPVNPRKVDAGALARAVVDDYTSVAQAKGVQLQSRIAEAEAWADPVRFQQVLSNLLANAIRLTPAGGTVEVRSRDTPEGCEIQVSDTGPGLDAEQRASLFQPFMRLHDHIEGRERGSGLGLYIVRAIVEEHGGSVEAASPGPGQGATFTVRLPRAKGPVALVAPAAG